MTVPYDCDAPASAAAPANPVSSWFFLMRAVLSDFRIWRQWKFYAFGNNFRDKARWAALERQIPAILCAGGIPVGADSLFPAI